MPRPLACVLCRQAKLRCDAPETYPSPCTRCAGRNTDCKIDSNYKRVATRKRLEQLTNELDQLRETVSVQKHIERESHSNQDHGVLSPAASGPSPASGTGVLVKSTSSNVTAISSINATSFALDSVSFRFDEAQELFRIYLLYYNDQFPVLDMDIEPSSTFGSSELLFWTVIFTAARNQPLYQSRTQILSTSLHALLGKTIVYRNDSISTIQAFLILSIWPIPVERQSDDMRWMMSSVAMAMAMQKGLHRVGFEHEYNAFNYSKRPYDEQKHTRVWRAWCFSNALLSCELGMPCLIPFEALELGSSDEAALPPDFLAKVGLGLYVSRFNDALGNRGSQDLAVLMRTIRYLERDINAFVFKLQQSYMQWNPSVDFVFSGIMLNLYSYCLRGNAVAFMTSPELALMQGSATRTACQMIKAFATAPFAPRGLPGSGSGASPQRCLPKFYFRFAGMAVLVLLKVTLLNKLPLEEMQEAEASIALGINTFQTCSIAEGDEYDRASKALQLLSKKEVIESARAKCPVESRLGASLMFELLAALVRWRREHGNEGSAGTVAEDIRLASAIDAQAPATDVVGEDGISVPFDVDAWIESLDFTAPDFNFNGSVDWIFR